MGQEEVGRSAGTGGSTATPAPLSQTYTRTQVYRVHLPSMYGVCACQQCGDEE